MKLKLYFALFTTIISFCSFSQKGNNSSNLEYTFELINNKTEIKVTLAFKPKSKKDTTTFKIPINFNRNSLDTLAITKGIKLGCEGILIQDAIDTYSYIGNEDTIVINYSVSSYLEETRYLTCEDNDYFMPIINKDFFHFYADKSLILPETEDENNDVFNTSIIWLNFPNKWEIANDFGILKKKDDQQKQFAKNITIGELGQVLFFGGKYRKSIFRIGEINFHTFIYGQYQFPDSALISRLEKVAQSNLDLWNYFGHKNDYVISLTQKGEVCGKIGGRNMHNSFAIYMSGNFTQEDLPLIFTKAFTHEFTHTWIGGNFISNNDEWEKMRWFVEGFCEYYAMLINVKSKILPREKFKDLVNKNYIKYRLSPYASHSLDFYSENYRFSSTLEKLAYTKGAAFAFYLDGYIRKESHSEFNLTDYMTALLHSEKKINGKLNLKLMNEMAVESVGLDISNLLDTYINRGEVFPLTSPLIETSKNQNYTSFDYGFDFIKSAQNEIISGVAPNSNAYKSGLRNGQKLISIKSITDKSSGLIILEIHQKGENLIIEYAPKGEEINLSRIEKLFSIN